MIGINTNVASLNAQNQLNESKDQTNQALERLSSGLRINSAKDDAAGLAISTRFEAQINGLDQASRNASDGISLAQTAEGGLEETTNSLQRVRELAVQAANGTNTDSDRASLQNEVSQLTDEIQRVADTAQFNGQNILDGSFDGKQFQVGANEGQTIEVGISDASADRLAANATQESTGQTRATTGNLTDPGTFELNSQDILAGKSVDGLSTAEADQSAAAFAQAINDQEPNTGVSAEVNGTVENLGTVNADADGITAGEFKINGVEVTAGTGGDGISAGDSDGKLRDAINGVSNQTGVTASLNDNNELELSAEDGRNIQIETGDTAGDAGTLQNQDLSTDTDTVTTGTVTLQSDSDIDVNFTAAAPDGQTFTDGTEKISTDNAVSNIDVSTIDGANKAINQADRALDEVNTIRSELGATQNRFESTISNLETTSTNLSAANSRIRDADFAAESAKLSQAQVLQQAGISVLGQANQQPQQALSLLQ